MVLKNKVYVILILLLVFSAVWASAEDIVVINKTGYDIYYLYISPGDSDDWEEDVLSDTILEDGGSIKLSVDSGSCVVDIQAVDEDDDSYIKWDFDICERSKIVLTLDDLYSEDYAGAIQDFTILNDTGYDVHYIFISPDYSDDWEEDVLGDEEILPAGESYDVTFSGYGDHCSFDIRLVDEDGDSYTKWGVDLCSTYTLYVSIDDLDE